MSKTLEAARMPRLADKLRAKNETKPEAPKKVTGFTVKKK